MVSRFLIYSTPGYLQAYGEGTDNDTYSYFAIKLNAPGIVYIHISLNPNIPHRTLDTIFEQILMEPYFIKRVNSRRCKSHWHSSW